MEPVPYGHYSFHNSQLLVNVLSQLNPAHILRSYFFKIHFSKTLPSTSCSSKRSLSFRFLIKTPCAHLFSFTNPLSHNPPNSCSSSLCSFLHPLSLLVLTFKQNNKTADGKTKDSDCTDRRDSLTQHICDDTKHEYILSTKTRVFSLKTSGTYSNHCTLQGESCTGEPNRNKKTRLGATELTSGCRHSVPEN